MKKLLILLLLLCLRAQSQIITATVTVTNTAGTAEFANGTLESSSGTNYFANFNVTAGQNYQFVLAGQDVGLKNGTAFITSSGNFVASNSTVAVIGPSHSILGPFLVTSFIYPSNNISVNGFVRTFTNNVTSANNQVQDGNTISIATSNLFNAFAAYPSASILTFRLSTNAILFQSYPGAANVITLGGSWGTVVYTTNQIVKMDSFRGTPSVVGVYEKTNTANGIELYLASTAVTNAIPTTAPALANFLPSTSLIGVTNYILSISTNGSNFTFFTSNILSGKIVSATNGIGAAAYHDDHFWQFGSANLTNWATLSTNVVNFSGLTYIEAGTGNILLLNTNGTERFRANEGGNLDLKYEDGNSFFTQDTSHNLNWYDHAGQNRIEIDDASVNNGRTVFRTKNGVDSLVISGNSDVAQGYSMMAFNKQTQVAVAIGTVTNFMADVANSGSADTDANSFTLPANTLNHDGDTVTRTIGLKLAANGNTKKVQVSFNANPVMTVAGVTISGGYINVNVTITRDSSSSYRYTGSGTTGASTPGTAGAAYASCGSASGVSFASTLVFKLILTGTSSSDITAVTDRIVYAPSHDYAF